MEKEVAAPSADFEQIDSKTNFKHRQVREMAAARDGYKYISEHIVKTYNETQSLRETGRRCGNISTIAVRAVLAKCNVKLRSPGGRVWSKLSDDDVRFIRDREYVNHQIFITIAKEVEEMVSKRLGKKTTISVETIRDVWKGKTHKEVTLNEGNSEKA